MMVVQVEWGRGLKLWSGTGGTGVQEESGSYQENEVKRLTRGEGGAGSAQLTCIGAMGSGRLTR